MNLSLTYLNCFNRYLHNISNFYIICNDYTLLYILYLFNNYFNLYNIKNGWKRQADWKKDFRYFEMS